MEALIHHFRLSSEGHPSAPGVAYGGVEGPKGEVGITPSGEASAPTPQGAHAGVAQHAPYSPCCVGTLFADFVATFCSLDIVLGRLTASPCGPMLFDRDSTSAVGHVREPYPRGPPWAPWGTPCLAAPGLGWFAMTAT